MAILPDDVWQKILEIGVDIGLLDYIDLCSLSATSCHMDRLSKEPALWATLLSHDFASSLPFEQTPSKDLYRDELEKANYECLAKWLDEVRSDDSSFYNWETGRVPVRSLDTNFDHMEITSAPSDINFVGSIVNNEHLLSLLMAGNSSQIPSRVAQPSARERIHSFYFEENSWRRGNKLSGLKVIPNSKSYVPLNRRQRRSLPRKI